MFENEGLEREWNRAIRTTASQCKQNRIWVNFEFFYFFLHSPKWQIDWRGCIKKKIEINVEKIKLKKQYNNSGEKNLHWTRKDKKKKINTINENKIMICLQLDGQYMSYIDLAIVVNVV